MQDGDVYGLGSMDRRNADKSGAEMKRGGGGESCVYAAESSYMAFCSQIIKSSLARAQLSGGSELGARRGFRKLKTPVFTQRFIEV